MNCPFCKGKGYVERDVDTDDPWRDHCDPCSSTGDYETMKILRACRLGEAKGHADALRRLNYEEPSDPLGFDTINSAVVDDIRRQRHEDMLAPGSVERTRLEAKVERLLHERTPLLDALASLAIETRDELHSYP